MTKKPCGCGCGALVNGTYKRGHWFKTPEGRQSQREKTTARNLGRVVSSVTREKIAAALRGRPLAPETVAKIIKANTGRKHRPESIEKTRRANLGRVMSAEARARMSAAQKQRALTKPETFEAAHAARRGQPVILTPEQKAKHKLGNLGRKHGPEVRANMSKGQRARAARTAPSEWGGWKGGISASPYPTGWETIKRDIRKRDGGLCLMCGRGDFSNTILRAADVHHIDGNKQNCEDKNLISLCRPCHGLSQNHMDESVFGLRSILTERYGYDYP